MNLSYVPGAGETVDFIIRNSMKPTWNRGTVLAISGIGVMLEAEFGDEDGDQHARWIPYNGPKQIDFRQAISFHSEWEHARTGNKYNMVCVTNGTATKEGWERMVVYKRPDALDEVFSRPVTEFLSKFVPVYATTPIQQSPVESLLPEHVDDSLLNSDLLPVEVQQ